MTYIEDRYIENMTLLANWLQANQAFITLDMGDYSANRDVANEDCPIPPDFSPRTHCQTPACVIGWATVALPGIEDFTSNYWGFSEPCFAAFARAMFGESDNGSRPEQGYGNFLFGMRWSDSIPEAIARLRYVIKNDGAPPLWSYTNEYA